MGVGRVGEGGGQKKKGGERGWGRGEGTHQFVGFIGTPYFFSRKERERGFFLHYWC